MSNEQRLSDAAAMLNRSHGNAWRQVNLVELNRRDGQCKFQLPMTAKVATAKCPWRSARQHVAVTFAVGNGRAFEFGCMLCTTDAHGAQDFIGRDLSGGVVCIP